MQWMNKNLIGCVNSCFSQKADHDGNNHRHIFFKETVDVARLPAQLAGRWGQMKWNSVQWGEKNALGRLEQPSRDKKTLYGPRSGTTSPTNQPRNSFQSRIHRSRKGVKASFKGTQDWEFFWLRFWILCYFIVSYAQILRYCKKQLSNQKIFSTEILLFMYN